jgi:beta-barrel assembly-enhancing protease
MKISTLTVLKRGVCLCALSFPLVSLPRPAQAMTDQQEIALGKSLLPMLADWLGPVLPDSDPVAKRVARVGAPFARLSKRRNIRYTYRVIANDKIPNALAAPGGFIYITRRLVKMTANDAELAAILGHETAHVDRRHAAERFESRERLQKTTSQISRRFLGVREHPALSLASDIAYVFFSTSYAREKESEADAYGVRWMSQLGYHPSAIVTALGRAPHKKEPTEFEKLVSRHPPIVQRQADLRTIIAQEKLMEMARKHGGPFFWQPVSTQASKP